VNIVLPSDREGWYIIRPERLSDSASETMDKWSSQLRPHYEAIFTRHCSECGRALIHDECELCDDCEGEAFAEDEWIEED